MAVAPAALFGRDLALAPKDARTPFSTGRAPRVISGRDNAAARNLEAIDNHEAAGGNDVRLHVKGDGPPGVNVKLGDLVPSDEKLVLFARDGFECRGID